MDDAGVLPRRQVWLSAQTAREQKSALARIESRKRLADVLRKTPAATAFAEIVTGPLGMADTGYHVPEGSWHRIAQPMADPATGDTRQNWSVGRATWSVLRELVVVLSQRNPLADSALVSAVPHAGLPNTDAVERDSLTLNWPAVATAAAGGRRLIGQPEQVTVVIANVA
jgi:hypothetical protein